MGNCGIAVIKDCIGGGERPAAKTLLSMPGYHASTWWAPPAVAIRAQIQILFG